MYLLEINLYFYTLEKNNQFIYQNSDTLNFYNYTDKKNTFFSFKNTLTVPMRLGTSFLDPDKNKLYVYELSDVIDGNSTIASIDLDFPEYWTKNSSLKLSWTQVMLLLFVLSLNLQQIGGC